MSRRGQPRFGWRPTKFCLFAQRLGFTAKGWCFRPGYFVVIVVIFLFFGRANSFVDGCGWRGQQVRGWMWMESDIRGRNTSLTANSIFTLLQTHRWSCEASRQKCACNSQRKMHRSILIGNDGAATHGRNIAHINNSKTNATHGLIHAIMRGG